MKNAIYLLLFVCLSTLQTSCADDENININPTCVADLAVTALNGPGAVLSGDPIRIICVISNVITTFQNSCTSSGETMVTVECAYSPTYKDKFSEYDTFDTTQGQLDTILNANQATDEAPMIMATNHGTGYYAIRVTADSENDNNSSNNSMAVVIRAD